MLTLLLFAWFKTPSSYFTAYDLLMSNSQSPSIVSPFLMSSEGRETPYNPAYKQELVCQIAFLNKHKGLTLIQSWCDQLIYPYQSTKAIVNRL